MRGHGKEVEVALFLLGHFAELVERAFFQLDGQVGFAPQGLPLAMEDRGGATSHLVGSGDDDGAWCLRVAGLAAHGLESHVGHLHGLLFDTDGEDQHVPGHAAVALELVQGQRGDGNFAKTGQRGRAVACERADDERRAPAQHALVGGRELLGRFIGLVDVDGKALGQPAEGGLDAGLQRGRSATIDLSGLG